MALRGKIEQDTPAFYDNALFMPTPDTYPERPTVLRFSRFPCDDRRSYALECCIGGPVNVIEASAVSFDDLDDISSEVLRAIDAFTERGIIIDYIEPPFTNLGRVQVLCHDLMLQGCDASVVVPVFKAESDSGAARKKSSRERELTGYEEVLPQFELQVGVREEPLLARGMAACHAPTTKKACVLRISRHQPYESGLRELAAAYGAQVTVENIREVDFPPHRLMTGVDNIVAEVEKLEAGGKKVVAIELIAPPLLVSRVVQDPRLIARVIDLIRPVFQRSQGNYATVGIDRDSGRDRLVFDRYSKLAPGGFQLSWVQERHALDMPCVKSLRPVSSEHRRKEGLVEFQEHMHRLLTFMADQDWQQARKHWESDETSALLKKLGVALKKVEYQFTSIPDFATHLAATLDSSSYRELRNGRKRVSYSSLILSDRGAAPEFDGRDLASMLDRMTVLPAAEEGLHALQYARSTAPFLSTLGERLWNNPYVQRSREVTALARERDLTDLSNEQWACELDVLAVYGNYGIKIPSFIWYGYRRREVLRLLLAAPEAPARLKRLQAKIEGLAVGEKVSIRTGIFDRSMEAVQGRTVCTVKRTGGGFLVSVPRNNHSHWGVFFRPPESQFWEPISRAVGQRELLQRLVEPNTQLVLGPGYELRLT